MSNWAPTRRALVLSLDVGLRVTSVKLNVTEYSVPAPSEKGGYSPPGRAETPARSRLAGIGSFPNPGQCPPNADRTGKGLSYFYSGDAPVSTTGRRAPHSGRAGATC